MPVPLFTLTDSFHFGDSPMPMSTLLVAAFLVLVLVCVLDLASRSSWLQSPSGTLLRGGIGLLAAIAGFCVFVHSKGLRPFDHYHLLYALVTFFLLLGTAAASVVILQRHD